MHYIVNVSGGLTSFEALRRVVAKHGNGANVIPIFANTRIEEPDLYRFLSDIERLLDITIIRLADGRTPFDVMKDRRCITMQGAAPCSTKLKRDVIELFVASLPSVNRPYTQVYGFDWSEMHRVKRMQELSKYPLWFPLIEKPLVTKDDIIQYLHSVGIQEPQLYKDGFTHSNCGGGCVKAGKKQFVHLLHARPDTFAYWEAGEQDVRDYLEKDVTILKSKQTLRQVREADERGAVVCEDDDDGTVCGCMSALFQAELLP